MDNNNIDITTFPPVLFVTGTDTDAGKSWATGWLAKRIMKCGHTAITQKLIQTGNKDMSEDIDVHRHVMGIPLQPRDIDHTTAPIILSYPASPDLAAKIDNVTVDFGKAARSTDILTSEYEHVLLEGAGGIMVPLQGDYLTLDYVKQQQLPAVLVTNGKLGSINHTLLALEMMKHAGIRVFALVYNPHFDYDKLISADTREYLQTYLRLHFQETIYMEMPANVLEE